MASKFIVWVDDGSATSNTYDYDNYNSNNQRKIGFQPNTTASSKLMNTALRQSTLITAALMNAVLGSNTTLTHQSTLSAITSTLQNTFPFNLNVRSASNQLYMTGNSVTAALSTVLGFGNTVQNNRQFVYGYSNQATGSDSFVLGQNLVVPGVSQVVLGQFNKADANDAFQIGYGTSSLRANIMNITKAGVGYIGGKKIYLNGDTINADTTDKVNTTDKSSEVDTTNVYGLYCCTVQLPDNTNCSFTLFLNNGTEYTNIGVDASINSNRFRSGYFGTAHLNTSTKRIVCEVGYYDAETGKCTSKNTINASVVRKITFNS